MSETSILNIPVCEGVYEWFDAYGRMRYVAVEDIGVALSDSWLIVSWAGQTYSVAEEWPKNWGKRVGDLGCISSHDLYTNAND